MISAISPRKIILVVDNLRVHHAKVLTEWLADQRERIELAFLPPYDRSAGEIHSLRVESGKEFRIKMRISHVGHGH